MKKILFLAIISIGVLGLSSCDKWLDVNTDPSNPTNVTASCAVRLPWIQHAYGYAYGNAAVTVAPAIGHMASRSSYSGYEDYSPGSDAGPVTPYQQWFVDGASNIQDLIDKAAAEEAWHYVAAAKVLKAMGFVLMADIYGEMPFTEALGNTLSPKYDDGKTIYEACLGLIDEALALFAKEQAATAEKLSAGDNWNGGDVRKWIKLCHGLKARWLNNMSKLPSYDMDKILGEIELGPANNDENTIIHHINGLNDMTGDPLVGDPLKTSFAFDVAAWGSWGRMNKWYMNLLTNEYTGGNGIEDPRLKWLVPSCQRWADLNGDGQKEAYWSMTEGVDLINSNIRADDSSAPMDPQFDTETKKWFINSENPARLGDTAYLEIRSMCAAIAGAGFDGNSTRMWDDGTVMTTGTFYTRPEAPTDVMTYHEMCFIKAEILLRKGDEGGALTAYRNGIKAHLEHMNTILKGYGGDKLNPYRNEMEQAGIDAFLNSSITAGPITMARIMLQKFIAMSYTVQNWNDMRRFNYSAGNIGGFGVVYTDYDRPRAYATSAYGPQNFPGTSKSELNYWFRRFKQCSLEIRYNSANLKASNPKAMDMDIWSVPVWWDAQ